MAEWTWPLEKLPRTDRTLRRFLVGVCPLSPTPQGVSCTVRLVLQQWSAKAAEPYSWCISLMKYGSRDGKSSGPFKPIQHVQVSEKDWDTWFSAWGDLGQWILGQLRRLQAENREIQTRLPESAD